MAAYLSSKFDLSRILGAIPQQSFESAIEKWRLPSGDSPSPVLQAKAGLMGAVAGLAQERLVERQKAMELKELKARAKLSSNTWIQPLR